MDARQHKREAVARQPRLIPLNDQECCGCQLMKKQRPIQKTYIPREIEYSRKYRWERPVGGAVSGIRRLLPPGGPLGRDPNCREDETQEQSQQSRYGETRPYRLGHPAGRSGASATVTRATYEETEDCCEPEGDCYSSRDPWYTVPDHPAYVRCGMGQSTKSTSDCYRDEYCICLAPRERLFSQSTPPCAGRRT